MCLLWFLYQLHFYALELLGLPPISFEFRDVIHSDRQQRRNCLLLTTTLIEEDIEVSLSKGICVKANTMV